MMKKTTLSILASTLMVFAISNNASAQKEQGQIAISVGAAYSNGGLSGIELRALASLDLGNAFVAPPILLNVDYAIIDKFSIGLAGSYQMMGMNGLAWGSETNASTSVTKTNIGIRPLFHFGGDNLDMYTGLRAGYQLWSNNYSEDNQGFRDSYSVAFWQSQIGIQFLFGFRAYFTEMIGVNLEVGIGSPYLASLGVVFRL